jgi:apolipoprotein N-acyltransferase
VVSIAGFAPFYAWPIPIASLAALFFLWQRCATARRAAWLGFAFGLGLFLAGVSWVYVSLHVYGHMPAILAALATLLFCSYLALFPAAAGWAASRLAPRSGLMGPMLFMPALFVLLEWIRGWLLTGFPWLVIGYSQVPDGPLSGFAPVVGAYGVSLAAAFAAGIVAAFALTPRKSRQRVVLGAAFLAWLAAGALMRMHSFTAPAGPPIAVSLLQGNVPQDRKWLPEVRDETLRSYLQLIIQSRAQVVVLPETALPAFLDSLPAGYIEAIRTHAHEAGKTVLIGTIERARAGSGSTYFNSVVEVAQEGMPAYRKRHLVPFGEFIPPGFRWVLEVLKIPLTDFATGAWDQPPLAAGGARWAVAICYEDIFGEELITQLPQASLLLNVSNDAWFGRSLAADQHLQFSQMRALETGRWMLRSTNTGVTAAIDERGRVVSALPQFIRGELTAAPVPRTGETPYVRWGNYPALVLLFAFIFAGMLALRHRPT